MGKHTATSKDNVAGGVLLAALASGVAGFAAASLAGAGTASGTCASISGVASFTTAGSNSDCTSSVGSVAVGLGPGTDATATGLGNAAIANGLGNPAGSPAGTTTATADGPGLDFAYAGGTK